MNKPFVMRCEIGNRYWLLLKPVEWLLLLIAIIWGGSYSAAKIATTELPVLQFLVLRFGLTFILLAPALPGITSAVSWKKSLSGGALLGSILLAIFVCETFGVAQTTASNAAFLISLCVVFTPFCEWFFLGQRPSRVALIACGLSFLGAALLAFRGGGDLSQLTWGDALMVLAAILRGVMVCMTRRQSLLFKLPALTLTAIQMGVMTVGSIILMIAAPGPRWMAVPATPSFWWAMAFLVLLCTILAFFVQNYAAARTSPSRVALLMGSEPLWGALIAVIWMKESMSLHGWIGGLLIVGSTWLVLRPRP